MASMAVFSALDTAAAPGDARFVLPYSSSNFSAAALAEAMAAAALASPLSMPAVAALAPLAMASVAVFSALATAVAASGGMGERLNLPYASMAFSAASRPDSRPASPDAIPSAIAVEASGGMGERMLSVVWVS